MNPWLSLTLGLAVLTVGAEALVRGGAGLALRLGLTPLVIGLTVVAFGTSSPEMVVSVQAALAGSGAIAVGNVIGSNICNIALILGLAALITPIAATRQVIRREVPVMIVVSILAVIMLWDGYVGRIEGGLLLAGLVVYLILTVRDARRETKGAAGFDQIAKPMGLFVASGLVLLGLAGLIWGARLFVTGAVTLAESWGWSEIVIGLTVVAIGTSLPELATSVVAALKKSADVALGNVVGSNIFNILCILGLAALVRPIEVPAVNRSDLGIMLLAALILFPLAHSGGRVSRGEGALLLAGYAGYTWWLIERAV